MGSKTVQVYGFPMNITAQGVKNFLENYTEDGSVFAVKVRHPKVITTRSRAYAIVQFLDSKDAEILNNLDQKPYFCYGNFYLKVRYMERDIVPKPKKHLSTLESAELHLGCLISEETLGVLWSCTGVKVHFGFKMKKINFVLTWGSQPYKLELSYESIWDIQLHCPSSRSSPFLVIQVQAAPRIYEMPQQNYTVIHEDPILNYFKEIQDDQWIRTTDFTPCCSIGQSFALCLDPPCDWAIPDFREYFFYYKEVIGCFSLKNTVSYSRSLGLVPIVGPPYAVEVPYKILFQVNQMVQNGTLMGPTLNDDFFRLISPYEFPTSNIEYALGKMARWKTSNFNPAKWLKDQYLAYAKSNIQPPSPAISDSGLVYIHRVQITPSKIYFYGPEINVSNRVIRSYSENIDDFIRVSFVEEDSGKIFSTDLAHRSADEQRTKIYRRILDVLRNGIAVGDKKFEFLAFSSSQLRENSAWMFASSRGLSATGIRKSLGDFSKIRNVAKFAARLGQSFSSSTETLIVRRDEIEIIPDIESAAGYLFSDGIGKISPDFARRVAIKCGLKSSIPSAFQIRYGGYKGVVAVDPTSSKKLSLRKSMSKFESENSKLDVLAYSKYQPCFLNRQLITLLSTLGVKDHIFEGKQEEIINQLDEILTDPTGALEAIELMFPGEITNILKEMLFCGYKPNKEPFLSMLLQTFRASKLFELKTKSRIFVPKGRAMIGCLDETRTLEYGQVFVQVSCNGKSNYHDSGLYQRAGSESDNRTLVLTRKVVVAKNPCLHPGDVRILMAIDVPSLHHMVDCVVFPQKGKRPHPNECSGSDLDGDIYFVTWDLALIPPREVQPMEYTAAPTETLDHDVTIEEVQEYFTNYIVNDSLGIIANAHTVFADKQPLKAESNECIELATLFSIAVDFPKTGVPAEIPPHLHVKEYPDFMEKLDKVTYESKGIIGKLFRAVKDLSANSGHIRAFTKEIARKSYDPDMEVDGFRDYLDEASSFKEDYDYKLGCLMDQYEIKTEAEILSGNVMRASKSFNKYKDGEAISRALRSLRKEAKGWFIEKNNNNDPSKDDAKASAWYHVTYHPTYWGCYNNEYNWPHFLSFPWCIYDKLILIKQRNMKKRKMKEAAGLSSLQQRLGSLVLR